MQDKIQEVTKQEYERFFKWIFGNDIKIKHEKDISLSAYYEDDNIYYTEEIYNLFQTQAMKREGKIMQLGSQIFSEPNSYHTRLEHSKGAYRNCVEFLTIQFRKKEWRKYIEKNKLKGYLVEKIKFMCVHDIGHSMLSHSIESLMGNQKCTHEDIGKKIIQEDKEIKMALQNITANEQDSNLTGDGSLEPLSEGNIDFDRMDFLRRDSLYLGEKFPNDLILSLSNMCDLIFIQKEKVYRYVYREEALPYIEKLLKLRDFMYKTQYKSRKTKITDILSSNVVQQIKDGKIKNTEKIHNYLNNIIGKNLNELNVSEYLKINDILFLNELISAVNTEENNEILSYILSNGKMMLQVAISLLDPKNTEYNDYSEEEKDFIKNLRDLIKKGDFSKKIKLKDIVLSIETEDDETEHIQAKINNAISGNKPIKGIYSYVSRFEKYNTEQPIYIQNKEGEIYTLDKYPDLQMDLATDCKYGICIILPELKEQGVSNEEINDIRSIIEEYKQKKKDNSNDHIKNTSRMNIFQTDPNGIDYYAKMNKFFKEEIEIGD